MGYDPYNLNYGNPMAGTLNDMVLGQLLEMVRNTPDWDGQFDAITRHTIEEFGNLQYFVPELYKRYSPMGDIAHIPSIGDWIQTWNLTVADPPTINYYNELRGLIEALPQVDFSKTLVGQKIVSAGEKVGQVFTWGAVSAMHAPATPDAIRRDPQFDAVVSIRDKAKETVDTVKALIDVVVDGGDGDDSNVEIDDDPLGLEAMVKQARDRVTQVTDGIEMLESVIAGAVEDVVDTAMLDKAEEIAKDVEQAAHQLDVMERTMFALIQTQQKYGPGVVTIPKVLQPLFRPLTEIFNFPQQEEAVTPKSFGPSDARATPYTAGNAVSEKHPENVQLPSAGRGNAADVPFVIGSKVAGTLYKPASAGSSSASNTPEAVAATILSSVKPLAAKPADATGKATPMVPAPVPAAPVPAPQAPTRPFDRDSNTQTAAAAMAAALLAAGRAANAAATPAPTAAARTSSPGVAAAAAAAPDAKSLGLPAISGNSMQLGPLSIKFSLDKDGKPVVPIGFSLHNGKPSGFQG
jgi:hypothetical protein